jgi:hypothetical protein
VVRLYDALGRVVARLGEQEYAGGTHALRGRGHDAGGAPLPSGIYFYRIDAGAHTETKQMILVR